MLDPEQKLMRGAIVAGALIVATIGVVAISAIAAISSSAKADAPSLQLSTPASTTSNEAPQTGEQSLVESPPANLGPYQPNSGAKIRAPGGAPIERTKVLTVDNTANVEVRYSASVRHLLARCVNKTTGVNVFIVETTASDTSQGYGPYCDTCMGGATLPPVGTAFLRTSAGTASVACGFVEDWPTGMHFGGAGGGIGAGLADASYLRLDGTNDGNVTADIDLPLGFSVDGTTFAVDETGNAVTMGGSLAVDTTTLVVNPTTNRVGVGTAPTHALQVVDAALSEDESAVHVTATMNASASAQYATQVLATGAGAAGGSQNSLFVNLAAGGYTGTSATRAVYGNNANLGGGSTTAISDAGNANYGGKFLSLCTNGGARSCAGVLGYGAQAGDAGLARDYGVIGFADGNNANAEGVGVYGTSTVVGTGTGGMFTLYGETDAIGTLVNAALIADNGAVAAPIFLGRVAGVDTVTIGIGGITTGNAASGAVADLVWNGDTVAGLLTIDVSADSVVAGAMTSTAALTTFNGANADHDFVVDSDTEEGALNVDGATTNNIDLQADGDTLMDVDQDLLVTATRDIYLVHGSGALCADALCNTGGGLIQDTNEFLRIRNVAAAADCDNASENGRIAWDDPSDKLCVCDGDTPAWKCEVLADASPFGFFAHGVPVNEKPNTVGEWFEHQAAYVNLGMVVTFLLSLAQLVVSIARRRRVA